MYAGRCSPCHPAAAGGRGAPRWCSGRVRRARVRARGDRRWGVAAVGHVNAPSRPLARPRRVSRRSRPLRRGGAAPTRPLLHRSSPTGVARHQKQRQPRATGTTARPLSDPHGILPGGCAPRRMPAKRAVRVAARQIGGNHAGSDTVLP
ncbi:hypothetical protein KCH_14470 [Kitasatospora cheerisanensis KCTC 2395]|uniref:Uncharacterized protein n=1 Tax=Kitasatospora cheerisanensis KCTC 2395 TaxID=1348663 RepID=A0A066Z006_9ACTN|nr:hypothetical protein KCH_14470 [Kitasatospora cheerisanensis KCTC 2395]